MEKNYKTILLTVLTLSVFTIAIIELTGISRNSLAWWRNKRQQGTEQTKTRDQLVHDMPNTTMQLYETKFSFGSVTKGTVVKHNFRFKNTGQNPLMIAKTDVTCGCTVPGFPQEAIAPGQEGEITVAFNTTGKIGFQEKNIIIHSNALPEAVSIRIDADVK